MLRKIFFSMLLCALFILPDVVTVYASEAFEYIEVPTPSEPNIEAGISFKIGGTFYGGFNIHGGQLEVAPFISQDIVMLPLRPIAEVFGLGLEWVAETRTVMINAENETFSLVLDSPLPNNMGTPVNIEGHTFVPLGYVVEIVGSIVLFWEEYDSEIGMLIMRTTTPISYMLEMLGDGVIYWDEQNSIVYMSSSMIHGQNATPSQAPPMAMAAPGVDKIASIPSRIEDLIIGTWQLDRVVNNQGGRMFSQRLTFFADGTGTRQGLPSFNWRLKGDGRIFLTGAGIVDFEIDGDTIRFIYDQRTNFSAIYVRVN